MLCGRCLRPLKSSAVPYNHLLLGTLEAATIPWSPVSHQKRYATTFHRRMMKHEELRNTIDQIASKNARRTDRVYVWGFAVTGALGVRSFLDPDPKKRKLKPRFKQFTPCRFDFMDANNYKAKAVACGYGFTVYICNTKEGHMVFGTGMNRHSQLGYQSQKGRVLETLIEPQVISLPLIYPHTTKLTHVACGRAHTWIASDTEGIFTLGANNYGQCGRTIVQDEEYRGSQIINKISFDKKIKQICCGQAHTLILTEEGQVYSCGSGTEGQTGLGHSRPAERLTLVGGDLEGQNIVHISSRHDTVLAVSDTGELFGWGHSEHGQLSGVSRDRTSTSTPTHLPYPDIGCVLRVATSSTACLILNDEGDVYVWGSGVLGKGPTVHWADTPTLLPRPLFGYNELNPDQTVVDLHSGLDHFAATTESGQLYMWGKNSSACLGLGNHMDQFYPFKVEVPAAVYSVGCGVDHTVVLAKSFA